MGVGDISIERLEKLVAEVKPSGGSEMSNYQLFVERLTGALGLPQPEFAREETRFNDYVFERNVTFRHPNGTSSTGRIDCYKRGCFVLEAKQSAKRQQAIESEQLALAGIETAQKLGHAKRGTKSWDKVMIAARRQAEDYARALPVDHGYPPFLLIVDVGNVIEVYADFSGLGKNYDHFPDRQNYRLSMDDLLLPEVQERLAAIWTAPQTLNPTLRAAEVTRDIAERLAKIAKRLEKKYAPVDIAQFLMRCLFTMFAEDVGPEDEAQRLIPNRGFERLLHQMIDTPEHFAPALESLWRVMDSGGYAPHLNASIKRFNGALFKDSRALKLDQDDILELHNAARRRWGDVEPAIFGTLLESALDPAERSQLGAHYTPRPYVERLVIPTIMEPLRADWEEVKAAVEDLRRRNDPAGALQAVRDFHHRLCTLRVLDPACGTGNFLYVSLELMKRLEGEVLDALDALGESESKLLLDGETVSPRQFFGLELNPRAVPIADLVLWKPRRTEWPEAEFIVGNPPFIGGKDMRAELGDGYAEACWKVRPDVPGGADFVMHFWDEAARRLTAKPAKKGAVNPLRRFGFITTNSITQTFSRRVVERWMNAKDPLSLIYAVPDHPWMKSADKAAVRIAMTVAQAGNHEGVLAEVVSEAELNTDAPKVELERREGKVTAKLKLGADLSKAIPLLANRGICSRGVQLMGDGFILTAQEANRIIRDHPESDRIIFPFVNGRDIAQKSRSFYVIDFWGLSRDRASLFPQAYQRVVDHVKPVRLQNNRQSYRDNWWIFGENSAAMRDLKSGLGLCLATVRTAKHRYFVFLPEEVCAESKVVVVGLNSASALGYLSSRIHVLFANETGGWQGVGNDPVYQHTETFDPFPFPLNPSPRLAELGERLDAFRKERLAAHDFLTMTGLYNALERVRELDAGIGDPLTDAERDTYDAGQIAILKELHDEIDREVFAAYGWSDLGERLVGRPGGTTPSAHKSAEQEAAEEELLVRLVALNQERAGEEKAGVVHWLRPDFQKPRLAAKVKGAVQVEADLGEVVRVETVKWPSDGLDQIRSVRDLLARAESPIAAPVLAAVFGGRTTPKRRERVEQVLETLVATGAARRDEATRGYYLPK